MNAEADARKPTAETLNLFVRSARPISARGLLDLLIWSWGVLWLGLAIYVLMPNVLTFTFAFLVVTSRMGALLAIAHDAHHGTFLPNRKWNDLIAAWLCAYPVGSIYHSSKAVHMAHHKYLNTADDPDRNFHFEENKSTPHQFAWHFLRLVFGGQLWTSIVVNGILRPLQKNQIGQSNKLNQDVSIVNQATEHAQRSVGTSANYSLSTGQLNAPGEAPAEAPVEAPANAPGEARANALAEAPANAPGEALANAPGEAAVKAPIVVLMRKGHPEIINLIPVQLVIWGTLWLVSGQWWLYFAIWLGPIFTLGTFLGFLRGFVDHARLPDDSSQNGAERLVTVLNANFLERAFLAPYDFKYHAEHHMFPSVPHYYLHDLHTMLQADENYRKRYLTRPSYSSFIKEYWNQISRNAVSAPRTKTSTD